MNSLKISKLSMTCMCSYCAFIQYLAQKDHGLIEIIQEITVFCYLQIFPTCILVRLVLCLDA